MLHSVTLIQESIAHGAVPGTTAITVIFALTYCGIAIGHVPGLRLDRTGIALLRKGLNPVPFLVALAVASNIGAAATLVGNPQDMMIAQAAKLSFGPYLLWCITPVALSLAAAYAIIWSLSRNSLATAAGAPPVAPAEPRPFIPAHAVKGLVILAVATALLSNLINNSAAALLLVKVVNVTREQDARLATEPARRLQPVVGSIGCRKQRDRDLRVVVQHLKHSGVPDMRRV